LCLLALGCAMFFSWLSAALRSPHSFPTRRSSDLLHDVAVGHLGVSARLQPLRHTVAARDRDAGRRHERGDRVRLQRPRGLQGSPDRKSTRLNSSHVKISYAVFCLKKKIEYEV